MLTNGFPVVFAVNFASFLHHAHALGEGARGGGGSPGRFVVRDLLARVGLFFGLHALVFAASALAFGSFGGDPVQALRVVAPTLVQAAAFGNLSGAYLYATLLGALPLHVAALARLHGRPTGLGAGLTLAVLAFALQAAALTALAILISALQVRAG